MARIPYGPVIPPRPRSAIGRVSRGGMRRWSEFSSSAAAQRGRLYYGRVAREDLGRGGPRRRCAAVRDGAGSALQMVGSLRLSRDRLLGGEGAARQSNRQGGASG